jgi:hypothetical protein
MSEPAPNIDNIPLPAKVFCPPEDMNAALADARPAFGQFMNNLTRADDAPLLLLKMQMQQQQL